MLSHHEWPLIYYVLDCCNRYLTVIADPARKALQFGKWQFEVTVNSFPAEEGGGMLSVGWDVPRETTQWSPSACGQPPSGTMYTVGQLGSYGVVIPGITPTTPTSGEEKQFGIAWSSDGKDVRVNNNSGKVSGNGMLNMEGSSVSGFPSFVEGDVITCCLSQDSQHGPCVYFLLNGTQCIPKVKRGRWDVLREAAAMERGECILKDEGVPITPRASYALAPTACLYAVKNHNPLNITFNVTGPFKHKVLGFEGIGAILPESNVISNKAETARVSLLQLTREIKNKGRMQHVISESNI